MSNLIYLSDICDFQGGTQPPKEQWSTSLKDGYVRMLQIRDFTQSEKAEPEYVRYSTNLKMCKSDDILIARYGASLGKILTGLSGAYNVAIMKTIPKENKITKSYLYYFLLSDSFQNMIKSFASRAAQAGFNKQDLSLIKLKCPSIEQQEEECIILNYVYNLIDKRKQQILLLDKLIKSRFIEMFGDPVTNSKMWKIDCLGNITTKIGSGMTPRGGKESYLATGVALIRSMNVHDGKFEYKDLAYISAKQASEMKNVELIENDVLFNITGASVTRTCVVPNTILPARVNQHVAIIRCINESLNTIFLNNLFLQDGFKYKLLNLARAGGATREAITKQQLEDLNVILPPIEIQNQFADFVKQTDKSKFVIQKSLNYLL